MADSLRDQLLKSGLVQKLKAEAKPEMKPTTKPAIRPDRPAQPQRPVHAPKQQQPSTSRASAHSEVDLARAYSLRARHEKVERDRAQREAEAVARDKRERKQKLSALLDNKALNSPEADVPRHFPHGNKIRRVYCTQAQLAQLNRGELAVVQLAGRYLLVARDIATQAQAIQAESLVLLCDPDAPGEDDVPADLVW
jgi:uncharacterized protein